MKLGVIMDPISGINVKKDSTLAMLLAAQSRCWDIYYMEMNDLYVELTEELYDDIILTLIDHPDLLEDFQEALTRPGHDTGQGLKEHRGQIVDIRLHIGRLAAELLDGGVERRTDQGRLVAEVFGTPKARGDSAVHEHGALRRSIEVNGVGLDVAVDLARGMHGLQSGK